ncbi:MAG: cytidine deaminase, partial [Rhizobiaceae bacterium]
FPVGACLRGEGGQLFVGVNVENPVPAMSFCAETSALGAMISAGERRLTDVLVIGGTDDFCPPCGGCRQRLMPFAHAGTMVHLFTEGGRRQTIPFADLLPLGAGTR